MPIPLFGSTLLSEEATTGIEVLVIGGGIAGLAASIHLARAGMRVACVQSEELSSDPVGESLDWSAPDLLEAIGLPIDALLQCAIATTKQHVILRLLNGTERHYVPGAWLAKHPFNVRLDTVHVDRGALARAIRAVAEREQVQVIADQVIAVGRNGRRIVSVSTKDGLQLRARWFIDASGGNARLFARTFDLPAREYGPNKVAIWDYFPVSSSTVEGTTLFGSGASNNYMDWIWQIPIRPGLVSVGCVASGDAIKQQRQSGLDVQQIYETRLQAFPSLASLLPKHEPLAPRVTSFRCRVHGRVTGPNWLVVGEAASMVDPMTSNGVTAALRHASEAAALIIRSRHTATLPRMATLAYAWRVREVASFFNSLIEKIMYEKPIRARIGALVAGDVYTIPAWLMNLFYSRTMPSGIFGSFCFGMVLRTLRASAATLSWLCRSTAAGVLAPGD